MNLGVFYRDTGRLDEAVALLEAVYAKQSQEARLRKVGSELFEAYIRAGKKQEALALLEKRLGHLRAATGQDSAQLAGGLALHASALLRLEAWDKSEAALRECLAIREKESPESWLTFNTQSMLGETLLRLGKLDEAEPLIVGGYQGMREREEEIPPAGKIRLKEAVERLVKLYEKLEKPEEAARWRKRSNDLDDSQQPGQASEQVTKDAATSKPSAEPMETDRDIPSADSADESETVNKP
jgi:tetratricopeptide (TPR) repeat protein